MMLAFGTDLLAGRLDPRTDRRRVVPALAALQRGQHAAGRVQGRRVSRPAGVAASPAEGVPRAGRGAGRLPGAPPGRRMADGARGQGAPARRPGRAGSGAARAAPGHGRARRARGRGAGLRRRGGRERWRGSRRGTASSPTAASARATLSALNVPVETRIRQIELNLDRYRWLPAEFEDRYILVNIPDFRLRAYDGGREAFEQRVIVGDEYQNATPVFADSMTYLVFRPEWNVPSSILVNEMLPKLREDIYDLARARLRGGGHRGRLAGARPLVHRLGRRGHRRSPIPSAPAVRGEQLARAWSSSCSRTASTSISTTRRRGSCSTGRCAR